MPKLTAVEERFILHWGEMGTRWGINRTVAQIHALLYLSAQPLPADEIATTLSVARSNVSNSLRELQGWGLVHVVHRLGDRRDHFDSTDDVYEMFRRILDERKRREIDPTLELLRGCADELKGGGAKSAYARERIGELREFFENASGAYEEMRRLPAGALRGLVGLRGKLRSLLRGAKASGG